MQVFIEQEVANTSKIKTKPESDLKLNALELMKNKKITNYKLFNKLNNIRVKNGGKLMNYTQI